MPATSAASPAGPAPSRPGAEAKTRVLLLTNAIAPDRIGGLERYVGELATALSLAGADVMVLTRRVSSEHAPVERTPAGVLISRYSTPAKSHPLYALGYPLAALRASATTIARERDSRVVHTHFPLPGLGAAVSRAPYVHTFHAPVHREVLTEHQGSYRLPTAARGLLRDAVRCVEQVVVRRPLRLITLSRFMAQEALALGAAQAKVVRIPGGIDTTKFRPGEHPVGDDRGRGPGPLLFTARRLVPRTGVLELVEAMTAVRRAVPGVRLTIAGRGPLEAQIRREIVSRGLNDAVSLLGWISEADLVARLRCADLVVIPTQELEGFGLATAEALACGTPVVGTPAGATPELLEQLDASLLTHDTSAAAIASTVIATVGRPQRLLEMAARARAVVHPAMSWPQVADDHLALYARLF